ncbi:MAG: UvrD-helicase domain-containing protein [Planctomycetia bacterium]|nr:UvrD-helicase domain-containing protein [Planctomycetia bacterium]
MNDHLNPAQRAAVTTLAGPLLVLAGAGSGKTRVVTHRIAELIRRGTPPERILAVTFTRKAAGEMQSRVADLLGKLPRDQKPFINTFHALCVQVLRRHITRLGYPQSFTIYDQADQLMAARSVLNEIRLEGPKVRPGDLLSILSRWKTAGIAAPQAGRDAKSAAEHVAAIAYRRYQQALQLAGAVDFDDLLLLSETLFQKFPEVRREESRRFSHVLVDEYQDTNGAQYRILKHLAGEHKNLCVVGDDDQSIYAWRGADVSHILRFQRDWPDAKVVRLEENYRSTRPILDLANRLIRFNRHRHDKALRTQRDGPRPRILACDDELAEANLIATEVAGEVVAHKARLRDFAILLRTNEQTRNYETALRRAGLPYVLLGGTSFFDRKEVRDVLAYLRAIAHPRDEAALRRIINTPARGISPATVARIAKEASSRSISFFEALQNAADGNLVSETAADSVGQFLSLLLRHRQKLSRGKLAEGTGELLREIGYEQDLSRQYQNPDERQARWNTVLEAIQALAEYEQGARQPSLHGFLVEVTLEPRDDARDKEKQLDRDAVVLLTLHGAKSLEFSQVYMVGMEEGYLPHRKSSGDSEESIDEERRLCYVGITRARDRLTLTLAKTRRKWGKPRPTFPSRFLYEMTGQADHPNAVRARKAQGSRTGAVRAKANSPRSNTPARSRARAAGRSPTGSKGGSNIGT